MKNAITKLGLRLITVVFVVFGALLFTATNADAQDRDFPIDPAQSQTLNWVTQAEAMAILQGQIDLLGDQLPNLVPGTLAHSDVMNHVVYYWLIYEDIEEGASVVDAVNNNINLVENNNEIEDWKEASHTDLVQLYMDALALLTF